MKCFGAITGDSAACAGEIHWTGRETRQLQLCDVHFERLWRTYVAEELAPYTIRRDRDRFLAHLEGQRATARQQPPPDFAALPLLHVFAKVAVQIARREAMREAAGLPELPKGPFR